MSEKIKWSLFEKILRFFFRVHFEQKDKYEKLVKDFPCPKCRPDMMCTFYYDMPCVCEACGRHYHI